MVNEKCQKPPRVFSDDFSDKIVRVFLNRNIVKCFPCTFSSAFLSEKTRYRNIAVTRFSTQDGSRYLFPVPRPLKLRISKNVLYAVCRIKACYTFHQETTFPCYMHMPIVLMNGLDIFYAVDKLLHFNDTVFAVPHILCN